MKKISPFIQWLILASAMALPFLIIRTFPALHHVYDLSIFRIWADAWGWGWQDIYINCESCNYPILGTAFSGGLFSSIDFKNELRVINRFRYYLALGDAVNVLMLYWILSRLKIQNAPLWAGIIGLLPTSWIGSSVWGQIEGMGQFLILLFFTWMIWFNEKNRSTVVYYVFLVVAGTLLSLMLLTKQLIYFSVGALGSILLLLIFLRSKKFSHIIPSCLAVGTSFILPVALADASLKIDAPYFSHLQLLVSARSEQWDVISSLGLNIWAFFFKDLMSSARVPVIFGTFSPYFLGIVFFLALTFFLFVTLVRDVLRQAQAGQTTLGYGQIISCLIYFSLVNLAFNLTLTGTHERYLYYFYPFILMACLGLLYHSRFFNRTMLTTLLFGALFYGAYLYLYLSGSIDMVDRDIIQIAAFVHLSLFVYLLYSWIRNSTSQNMDALKI